MHAVVRGFAYQSGDGDDDFREIPRGAWSIVAVDVGRKRLFVRHQTLQRDQQPAQTFARGEEDVKGVHTTLQKGEVGEDGCEVWTRGFVQPGEGRLKAGMFGLTEFGRAWGFALGLWTIS